MWIEYQFRKHQEEEEAHHSYEIEISNSHFLATVVFLAQQKKTKMLQILTVNVWNLPLVSQQRRHRLEALQQFLLQFPVDVLCLQEVWVQADWRWLREQLYAQLPYGYYFRRQDHAARKTAG